MLASQKPVALSFSLEETYCIESFHTLTRDPKHQAARRQTTATKQTECQKNSSGVASRLVDASLAGLLPPRNSRSAVHPRVAERRGRWVATVVRFAIWDGA